MDNKEAIEYLMYMKHDVQARSPVDVAIDTAIEALKETAKKPKSNADRIRKMTDEELFDFLDAITDTCGCWSPQCDNCPMKYKDTSPQCDIQAWLKQEVSEDACDRHECRWQRRC